MRVFKKILIVNSYHQAKNQVKIKKNQSYNLKILKALFNWFITDINLLIILK